MFKKLLLIISLAASLSTQANPFTYKNTVRGLAVTATLANIYCAMGLLLNTYMTPTCGFKNLGLSPEQRLLGGLGVGVTIFANAWLFKFAKDLK